MFATSGPGQGIRPVEGLTMETPLPVSHEAGACRPDIGFASRGGPSHGFPPRTTPHEQMALEFVKQVEAVMTEAMGHDTFQRLVLVAPPRALGEHREMLPETVRRRVAGELDLDLTKAPTEGIQEHVHRFLVA